MYGLNMSIINTLPTSCYRISLISYRYILELFPFDWR